MGNPDAIEEATSRLSTALQALEDSVMRQMRQGQTIDDLQEQIRSLTVEHERLVASLEAERQRADRLQAANGEASNRLDTIINSVKSILQTG
ncbi:MAG: DUF4164 domain-containing protein [Hyphomicrobiales bacterium]|nr:DUF4164 domain-containing protein [Hyphomicrobiales bacterium]